MSKRTVDERACLLCRPQHSWPATHPLRQRNSSLKNATKTTKMPPRPFLVVVVWFVSEEACYGTAAVDIIYSLFLQKRFLVVEEESESEMKHKWPLFLQHQPVLNMRYSRIKKNTIDNLSTNFCFVGDW